MRNTNFNEIRTRNPLSGKPVKVRRSGKHKGAIGRLNALHIESMDGDFDSLFGGRWKAKRDAKAAKKVRKANAPSWKERKASKVKSKNILRGRKGESKLIKAGAKQTKAERGGGKVGDTLNKALELGTDLLSKKKGGEDEGEEPSAKETVTEKTFMQKYGVILGIVAFVIVAIIIAYFVTKKK